MEGSFQFEGGSQQTIGGWYQSFKTHYPGQVSLYYFIDVPEDRSVRLHIPRMTRSLVSPSFLTISLSSASFCMDMARAPSKGILVWLDRGRAAGDLGNVSHISMQSYPAKTF